MQDAFAQLLNSLANSAEPLDRARLVELSDLNGELLDAFSAAWKRLADGSRQSLLQELGLLADSQIELTFDPINRMALTDAAAEVRVQAIENLWESEDPALAELFLAALDRDPSDQVRSATVKALGTFVLLGETQRLPAELLDSIERGLLEAHDADASDDVRNRSLESLGFSSRPEVPRLIEAAYQSDSETRLRAALRAMGRSANPRWADHVLARLHHPSPQVRLEAVEAIGEIDARHAATEVVDLIEDVDDRVRKAAIWSLGQLGGQIASEALGELIENAEDGSESSLIQDSLDNMDFIESTRALLRFEYDELEG